MDPIEALRRCGGRASTAELKAVGVRDRDLAAVVAAERVAQSRRGHYRLTELNTHLDVAIALTAILSHRSAALHHGLKVATAPEKPEVIVRRDRRLTGAQRALAHVRYRDLRPHDVEEGVTSLRRTILDCARDLPFAEALTVADSVLHQDPDDLPWMRSLAADLKGRGATTVRKVLRAAAPGVANAFESSLRAIALEAGLDVRPQFMVADSGVFAKVDLADEGRQLIVEAESFEFHADRKGFRKDVRRYSELTVLGWHILRFTWEDVMFQPGYVRWALESWRRWHDFGTRASAPPTHLRRLA